MRITTESAIDISESLASFILASHLYNDKDVNPVFEKRLKHVKTGKFSVADIYLPTVDCAIEMKSKAHGNDALKGVVQASVYKEQTGDAIFCMQKPNRRTLANKIEGFAESHGVGVVWITGIPTICSERTIQRATGGTTKPFELWKQRTYVDTKKSIASRSMSGWADEYIDTLEKVICEYSEQIFDFSIAPDGDIQGFSRKY